MCGVAGIVALAGGPVERELLERMAAALSHRGPDGFGVHVDAAGGAGLAHARRSIVDLAGGAQPMCNEDRRVWVTFNGEIFNYVELREELQAKGHRFATQSDTEVLVHLYEEDGTDLVQRLNGQWAFAIWDASRRVCFLSRDRLGICPLYYTRAGGQLVFGSEIKSILLHPEVRRSIDVRALDDILTFWSALPPRSAFENISQLAPAHSLIVERGEVRTWRYWQIDYEPDGRASEQDHVDEVLALLADATRLRLRADVPVGAYLSGGLDSSLLAALASRASTAPLETFSVAFEDPEYDESAYQRRVVEHLRIARHHEVRCSGADIAGAFPDVVWHAEQPLVRTAPAPMFLLSRLVRDCGLRVTLTGEGSDELFGGYDLFKEAKVRRFCARAPGSTLRPRLLRRLYPYLPALQAQPEAYVAAFFRARSEDLSDPLFSHLPRLKTTARAKMLLSDDSRAALATRDAPAELRERLPPRFEAWDPLCRAQFLETEYLLPGYLLSAQGDRMAMAHGVEVRFPFLDHRLVERAARVPPRLKMRALNEKYVLKRAAASFLPREVYARPKQPYRAVEAPSFFDCSTGAARAPWVEDVLSDEAVRRSGIFDSRAVSALVQKVRREPSPGASDVMALAVVASTQLLLARFVECKRVE
jgi:asparagine synthase (glutamine-hydrolysing)